MDDFKSGIDHIAMAFEAVGVLIIAIGTLISLVKFIPSARQEAAYKHLRVSLGKVILLGLEVLVAGDIIATVATKPHLEDTVILGIIVLIRIILSLAIQVEINGRLPWRKKRADDNVSKDL